MSSPSPVIPSEQLVSIKEGCLKCEGENRMPALKCGNRLLKWKDWADRMKEWNEQRPLFEHKKTLSLEEPWTVSCITLYGMDQAKANMYAGSVKASERKREAEAAKGR